MRVEEISLRTGQSAFTAAAIGAGMTVGEPIFLPDNHIEDFVFEAYGMFNF
jgi:hypothetical protein